MTEQTKEPWFKKVLNIAATILFFVALAAGIGYLSLKTDSGKTEGNTDNYFLAHTKDPEGYRTSVQNKCLAAANHPNEKTYCECTTEAIMQLPEDRFNTVTTKLFSTGLTGDDYVRIASECNGLL